MRVVKKVVKRAVAGTMMLGCLAGASAAPLISSPVPSGAYITLDGLDWAWASPAGPGFVTLSDGWEIPTAADFATVTPLATNFLFMGANVPYPVPYPVGDPRGTSGTDPVSKAFFDALNGVYEQRGSAGACAAPYFTTFTNCDWGDGLGQNGGLWFGMEGSSAGSETLVVRISTQQVPEPGSLALVGLSLAALTLLRRSLPS